MPIARSCICHDLLRPSLAKLEDRKPLDRHACCLASSVKSSASHNFGASIRCVNVGIFAVNSYAWQLSCFLSADMAKVACNISQACLRFNGRTQFKLGQNFQRVGLCWDPIMPKAHMFGLRHQNLAAYDVGTSTYATYQTTCQMKGIPLLLWPSVLDSTRPIGKFSTGIGATTIMSCRADG